MRAVTWQGTKDVRVEDVPDPVISEPTDAIVKITSTAICGSDLHLYEPIGFFMEPGDILGHEPMGIVEAVGNEVTHIAPGDRVVIPFNVSCGTCYMCNLQRFAQCETTQVRAFGKGAALFGYTKLYGQVPGGQAEYLRVPMAHFGPIKVPQGPPDDRFLYLSDILPTAWQAAQWADIPKGGSVTVMGLGPVGQFCARIARYLGAETVIGVDPVPERVAMAARHGVDAFAHTSHESLAETVKDHTDGRGTDAVIDAVGMEAHGSPVLGAMQRSTGLLPSKAAEKLAQRVGVDRLQALESSFDFVKRGGTVSIIGVYGGQTDPISMFDLFDKGLTLRMGQAHVKRWVDDIMPLVIGDDDPLGTADLVTHTLPLDQAPHGYDIFQRKQDGCIKVILQP